MDTQIFNVFAKGFKFEAWFFLIGLISITFYRILTRRISTRGLLSESTDGSISPARVQMLFITLGSAFFYLLEVADSRAEFPNPQMMLLVIGGSNLTYLGAKAYSLLFSRSSSKSNS